MSDEDLRRRIRAMLEAKIKAEGGVLRAKKRGAKKKPARPRLGGAKRKPAKSCAGYLQAGRRKKRVAKRKPRKPKMSSALMEMLGGLRKRKVAGAKKKRRGGAKTSPWIAHVKRYARDNGVSYKDALSMARASYRG